MKLEEQVPLMTGRAKTSFMDEKKKLIKCYVKVPWVFSILLFPSFLV